MRLQQEALTEHDRLALALHRLLSLPVVRDLRLTPLVFDALGLALTRHDARRLIDKLDVIHTESAAPPPPDGEPDEAGA